MDVLLLCLLLLCVMCLLCLLYVVYLLTLNWLGWLFGFLCYLGLLGCYFVSVFAYFDVDCVDFVACCCEGVVCVGFVFCLLVYFDI